MERIKNSGQDLPQRDSNNLKVLKAKVINPRKANLINPGTHY